MHEMLKKHHVSFSAALDGILWAITTQPNFRVHLFLSAVTISVSIYLQVSRIEFIILIFTILLGLVVEMINTSIESVTDLVTSQWNMQAKIAKDVAAGMMLLTAMGAVVVAILIFLPHILN